MFEDTYRDECKVCKNEFDYLYEVFDSLLCEDCYAQYRKDQKIGGHK